MSYQKHQLNKSVRKLSERITYLKAQLNPNKQSINFYSEIIHSIESYVKLMEENESFLLNNSIDPLLVIIKKQALIIKAAKIQYPTINQSIEHIQDIYFSSTGQLERLGSSDIKDVEIPII